MHEGWPDALFLRVRAAYPSISLFLIQGSYVTTKDLGRFPTVIMDPISFGEFVQRLQIDEIQKLRRRFRFSDTEVDG